MGRWLMAGALGAGLTQGRRAEACLWDSDTLEQEAAGAPSVVVALVGGFAINPPKYYAMRLARVGEALTKTPDELALYDDVAVASDRIGKHDEAIEWMVKKHAALKRLGVSPTAAGKPNHWYRYHANRGTFHAHRWLHASAKVDESDDLKRAHELIGKAIADNPDAHFGREKYQHKALAWLLAKPVMPKEEYAPIPTFIAVDANKLHSLSDNTNLADEGLADAVAGIAGLITLGAAWNSFDVTAALAVALAADGKHSLLHMALLRCREIVGADGGSLIAGAPKGAALVDRLPSAHLQSPETVDKQFAALRRDAKAWNQRRTTYLSTRLERGEHPDTAKDFWAAFDGDPHHMGKKGEPIKGLPGRGCACRAGRDDSVAGWAAAMLGLAVLGLRRTA
jgi:MYXO-CTERM domain-containing protein